jgi:hypothetical protein
VFLRDQTATSSLEGDRELMRLEERMILTAILRTGSLVVGAFVAYFASLSLFSVAIENNVSPNTAYGAAILVFVAILAVWIGKLVVKIHA